MTSPRATRFGANTRLVFGVEGKTGEELILTVVRMFLVRIEKHVVVAHAVERVACRIKIEEKISICNCWRYNSPSLFF